MRILPVALIMLALPVKADIYRRQPSVDVAHYEIAIEVPPSFETISGRTRVHVIMREKKVGGMWLDFDGLNIEALTVGGNQRPFEQRDGKLFFEFDRPYVEGEIAIVEVNYRGRPKDRGILLSRNRHGRQVLFAENWPNRAHYWFPCIDHPSDKATVEFAVTVPEKYDVAANGRLLETRALLDGRRLHRWGETVPVPTYCMVIGVAEFSVTHAGSAAGVPLVHYAYPQDAAAVARKFARTNLVIQYFQDLIGPYPYEKLAQVQSTTKIGGMENASVIFYAEEGFQKERVGESPVPHEIAHQWFGDSVTPIDWDHLWISEGFATYFSALFYERLEGPDTMRRIMARAADAIREYHKKRVAPIIDPELTDLVKKLNPLNYQKGSWILHMLRRILGDETFFNGIRRYYNLYAGKNASTDDFQRVMEAASGKPLGSFFNQWFFQTGWPEYQVSWGWSQSERTVVMTIRQTQDGGLYDVPLEIAFDMGDRRELHAVRVFEQHQRVVLPLPARPTSVEVDPEGWVLKSVVIMAGK